MIDAKKIIELKHHKHDYECMWNGIEDLYMNRTGENLPENFFFLLAAFGVVCYRRTAKADIKRMIAFGDGRTAQMYKCLSPIVGFEYKHHSFTSFASLLKKAKKEIGMGFPVVLGALDMFHLPYYEKIYHKEHIPYHYILMVGYDDEKECIYLYDCGRSELQILLYKELFEALNCNTPGLSKENTLCTIRMFSQKNKYQIAKEALYIKKTQFLNPPVSFLGYKGFERFIDDLPTLRQEVGDAEYNKILLNMVTYLGTVPMIPNAIRGINEPNSIPFRGSFDKMSAMLQTMGSEYHNVEWIKASTPFFEAGLMIEEIVNIITAYLAGTKEELDKLSGLFAGVLRLMKQGFKYLA